MLWLSGWFLCGLVSAMIGSNKGEGCAAFIIGVLLGPFGILIAIFSPGNRIKCPFCKELMHEDATTCPHCQKEIHWAAETKKAGLFTPKIVLIALAVLGLIGVAISMNNDGAKKTDDRSLPVKNDKSAELQATSLPIQ